MAWKMHFTIAMLMLPLCTAVAKDAWANLHARGQDRFVGYADLYNA
jgi:hypothetical protein